MKKRWNLLLCLALVAAGGFADTVSKHMNTVSGMTNAVPKGYVPPLVSNGSLCMLVDYLGGQAQRSYVNMTPTVFWEGRRYGPPNDQLIPFGHFDSVVSVDGKTCPEPATWTQTLDTRSAAVICRNDFDNGLSVETTVFTPLVHNLVVIKKRISSKKDTLRSARVTLNYRFTPQGNENRLPRRVTDTCAWNEASQSAEFLFQADAYRECGGIVSAFSDKPVTAAVDKQVAALTAEVALEVGKPAEVTFYLLFADSLDGKDYLGRAAKLQALVRQEGYDGLFAGHRKAWAAYWDESYVNLPDAKLETAYCTAQYHLRANATQWSFPVGIFSTHWAGRFFGWDEMFCYQALVSSNHRDIARRGPEFRYAGLQKALYRNAHYGKAGTYGAHYPWETLEDGAEAAPPGFWMEHMFHMSNIALAAWFQYLYTEDQAYLEKTGYPVVKECARFFLSNVVYEAPDGGMFIGKCTDLERLGPARQNPFMTSCGAIYTLESAAQAAAVLKADVAEAAAWRHAAAKLRESLPCEGDRYVPYVGCKDESVASLGGLFPYPVFDETSQRQRNAVYHFVKNGRAFGNMYQMGTSVCAWYLGWMAAALAELGDKTEPAKMLDEAASGAGCFGEMFEINEAQVSRTPWFSTASGNVVYALNQMLVQNRGERILIAQGVPEAWKDYAFKLACHGDLAVDVEVKGGRLVRLTLLPGNDGVEQGRTLVLPAEIVDEAALDRAGVKGVTAQGANIRITVRFKGYTELVLGKKRS